METESKTDYRAKLHEIRGRMLIGALTVEEAKEEAQPFIDEMNAKARIIAEEYGRRHKNFTFGYLMR